MLDIKDTAGNETVHMDITEHGLQDMEDIEYNQTVVNELVITTFCFLWCWWESRGDDMIDPGEYIGA